MKSELVARILDSDPDVIMPPPESNHVLTKKQKEILSAWIASGAEYQPHWAYVPPERHTTPKIVDDEWSLNWIDHFIFDRLTEKDISPATDADPITLVRRVTFDLTGLPPTPSEIDSFWPMNHLIDMNNSSIDCWPLLGTPNDSQVGGLILFGTLTRLDTMVIKRIAHHHIVIGSLQHFKRIYDLIDLLRCNSRVISSSPVQMNTLKTFSSPVPITVCCRRLMRVDCRSKNTEQSIRLTESEIFLGVAGSNCWLCSVP